MSEEKLPMLPPYVELETKAVLKQLVKANPRPCGAKGLCRYNSQQAYFNQCSYDK